MKIQAMGVLLVLSIMLIAGCIEISEEEIVTKFNEQQGNVQDYSATLIITSSAETSTVKMMIKKPDKYRIEYLEPSKEAGKVVVSDGSTAWTYYPASNEAYYIAYPEPEDTFILWDYYAIVKNIMEENKISYLGTESIGEHGTYVIDATPENPLEFNHMVFFKIHVWIDRKSWMILKMEMYDEEGNPILKVESPDTTFNICILDSEFIFVPPKGVEVVMPPPPAITPAEVTFKEAQKYFSVAIVTPTYLPEGYALESAWIFGDDPKKISLIYKKGSEVLQLSEVVVEDAKLFESLPGESETVDINGTVGEFVSAVSGNTLHWSSDDIEYLLNGMLKKEEMVKIAKSMQ